MRRINIIDSSVYNRISAGEVIERPMSVVKECVENSIDGGATSISVYVSNNAKNIRIIDNGCGMSEEDAKIAFLPHTTSKISTAEDLNSIMTLGFRGEALASIASVAMVTLNTFDKESKKATKIFVKGGQISETTESSITEGTDINVENLFFNTPVREKFLKSPKSEEAEISDLISKFILAYPNLSIKFYLNSELKTKFDGDGFEKALYCVYGKNAIDNCVYVDEEKNGISVKGYTGKIGFTKPNRTYQTVILNGRNVVNETISMAVFRAYQPYLMKRCFPFYVLSVTVPTDTVDVNVHPTKHDVRFSDNKIVFSAIYAAISNAITKSNISGIDRNIFSEPKVIQQDIYQNASVFNGKTVNSKDNSNIEEAYNKPLDIVGERIIDSLQFAKKTEIEPFLGNKNKTVSTNSDANSIGVYKRPINPSENNGFYLYDSESTVKNAPNIADLSIIGVFNRTYILAECDNTLYFIDQHAAHERILYDKYTLSYYNQKVMIQDLLVPYMLDLNAIEEEFMRKNITNLYVLGFRIENFGQRTYRITAVPADLTDIDFDKFFGDIFADLSRLTSIDAPELIREQLMQKACKNAVKAGQALSDMEIKQIFSMLTKTEVLTCPHGRPIVVAFSLKDVEKMFKRIV